MLSTHQLWTREGSCPTDLSVLLFQSLSIAAPIHFTLAVHTAGETGGESSDPHHNQRPPLFS